MSVDIESCFGGLALSDGVARGILRSVTKREQEAVAVRALCVSLLYDFTTLLVAGVFVLVQWSESAGAESLTGPGHHAEGTLIDSKHGMHSELVF